MFHLDTSVRLHRDSIAAAHVFIESPDVKVIEYAGVCMFDRYSRVMHNYEAIRDLDPGYVNSVVNSLYGDLVQVHVDRNICSNLSSLWEHHNN